MFIVVFLIFLFLISAGCIVLKRHDWDWEDGCFGGICVVIGIIGIIIIFITAMIYSVDVSKGLCLQDKLDMYEAENEQINNDIATTISNYMTYEQKTYVEFKPESATTLISLYPDLKSDTLIQSQIEIYLKNREKIIKIKEDIIELSVKKWWLYFGG